MKTQIGLPVQYFEPIIEEVLAATIVGLGNYPHVSTNLIVFSNGNNPTSQFVQNVRHKDFKKDNEPYWDFLDLESD